MRMLVIFGCVIAVALLLYGVISIEPEGDSLITNVLNEDRAIVDLGGGGTNVGLVSSDGKDAGSADAADLKIGEEQEHAYEEAVDSFADFYRDTISEVNPLVHTLLMDSEGEERMTDEEARELGDLLSEMESAPDSEVVGSYPEGYAECAASLRAGAVSLELAAGSIRGFNRSADMKYLEEYQGLIGIYLQAMSDARSCVSDHLYPAYP
jgi:hypothetical protein